MDSQSFQSPAAEYRGVTLWMLNDKLQTDQIIDQLEGFKRAGWGAVIGRTFNGLLTEYLSDEWMEMVDALVTRAGELGLRVWLQAGYMPSAVPDLPEAIQYKGLARRSVDEPGEPGEAVLAVFDDQAYCMRSMENVLDLLNGQAVTEYLDKAYRNPWYGRFGDQFGKTIEAIWVDEPHFRPNLLPWSSRLAELFRRTWGYEITEHLPELFSAVGDYRKVRHHYWRTVLGMFVDAYFVAVGQWCQSHNVKFSGHLMGEDTLNSQVAWTGAAMPCYEYMQLPGIDHLTLSLKWPTAVKSFLLPPKQASSVAAQLGKREVLAEIYAVSSHRITFEERKRISDWMAVLGINYRCIHGSFYSMRGRRKRIYVPHLSYQQPWWDDNHLASDYFARVSYAGRQGKAVADVLVVHPEESAFCLYDPTKMDRPHDRACETGEIRAMDDTLIALSENLLKIHRDFHFGDETLMAKYAQVRDAKLYVGQMAYKVVVLPPMITMRETTMELLTRFAAAGGKVLTVGQFPDRIDGVLVDPLTDTIHDGLEVSLNELRLAVNPVDNEAAALKLALDGCVAESVEIVTDDPAGGAEDVWVQTRKTESDQMYFLVNTSPDQPLTGALKIRGHGMLSDWGLQTGAVTTPPQCQKEGFVFTPLSLAPGETKLFVLKTAEAAETVPQTRLTVNRTIALDDTMAVDRDGPNALTLDTCRLRKGDGPWSDPLPVITVQKRLEADEYSGPVTLQFSFDVTDAPKSLCVVIEDAANFDITINGQPVAYAGLPHFVDRSFGPVDICEHVTAGANTLELSIDFRPVAKSTFALASLYEVNEGTELESIYLIGDFALTSAVSAEEAHPMCVRLQPRFSLTAEPAAVGADLTAGGYPFFAGRVTLSQTVQLPELADGEKVLLRLGEINAVLVKVRVNGRDAGAILWKPYEVDITDSVTPGANKVEIELVSSLRNLLGHHHRTTGEPDDCRRTAFDDNRDVAKVFEHREEARAGWTDDYFCIHFGFGGGAEIVVAAEEPTE